MRVIAYVSGTKGGTGKTTLAVNLAVYHAYALSQSNRLASALIDAAQGVSTAQLLLLGDSTNLPSLSDYHDGSVPNLLHALYIKRWRTPTTTIQILFGFYPRPPRNRSESAYRSVVEGIRRLGVSVVHVDSPPVKSIDDAPIIRLADILVPVVTPDDSAIAAAASLVSEAREARPDATVAKPVLNMYNGMEPPGDTWGRKVAESLGDEPHIVPADVYVSAARQAMEIEVLKLLPSESPAVRAIIQYGRYLLGLIGGT